MIVCSNIFEVWPYGIITFQLFVDSCSMTESRCVFDSVSRFALRQRHETLPNNRLPPGVLHVDSLSSPCAHRLVLHFDIPPGPRKHWSPPFAETRNHAVRIACWVAE